MHTYCLLTTIADQLFLVIFCKGGKFLLATECSYHLRGPTKCSNFLSYVKLIFYCLAIREQGHFIAPTILDYT